MKTTLSSLKKQLTKVAVRYKTKSYLQATYEKEGRSIRIAGDMNNIEPLYVFISGEDNIMIDVNSAMGVTDECMCAYKDLELKGLMLDIERFAKKHKLADLKFYMIRGEIHIEAMKKCSVDINELENKGDVEQWQLKKQ